MTALLIIVSGIVLLVILNAILKMFIKLAMAVGALLLLFGMLYLAMR
jgi:hypothetical protein